MEASAKRATISGLLNVSTTASSTSNLQMKQIEAETQKLNEDKNDNDSEALVSIYPNLAIDQVFLERDSENSQQVLIDYTLGNLLFQFDPTTLHKENARNLLPMKGIYLISILKKKIIPLIVCDF
ncbi:hypothetical protein [Cyclobacterium jeungdonense]|uniref:Por secretion system C-terminal sorting domain-containing protein n=2 Tax=Cyclobacterium jeungdonense TaxID=708087 RepID=A0ABT8C3D8_9BACT|nr:hypothetical protein [Cyclobacterium jeungdonense]MDN3686564.1 hypothetical protein [Cyclobacterium jeungdonense]